MSPAGPNADGPNLYQVLGLPRSASAREIREAYHRLARLLHPDRAASRPANEQQLSERRMREVNAAYAVLGDEAGRRDYDRAVAGRTGSGARSSGPAADGGGATRSAAASRSVHLDASRFRFDAEPEVDDEGRRLIRGGDAVDEDEPDLSPMVYFLLRKGPIIAALLVAIFLFVLTAYATVGRTPTKAPITDPRAACVETPAEPCAAGP